MNGLDLAMIGNSSYAALVDRRARIVWACLPRFDSDPFFCHLVDGGNGHEDRGYFDVELLDLASCEQRYLENTAIVVTVLRDDAGNAVEVRDFAPRFRHHGRDFRPPMLVRLVQPLSGTPRIRMRLRPSFGYGQHRPQETRGSNHVRYVTPDLTLRLTTDIPVSYVQDEVAFLIHSPLTMLLGPDESLTASIEGTGREFFEHTRDYWLEFTRYLSIPFEWQEAVIRAAITLKLCTYDETGAVVAAPTTSIPEAADSGRNWDYRYCWLRDAYFVVHALNRLGATGTLERFLAYINNLVAASKDGFLQPVFGISRAAALPERVIDTLAGYRGMGPVRVGNEAYQQVQNDVYGSVVLACTHVFFDQRLRVQSTEALFNLLQEVGEQAARRFDHADAGIWEHRQSERVHTLSSVMCWAACDRLGRIAVHLGLEARAQYWTEKADEIRAVVEQRAWSESGQHYSAVFDGDEIDASLLLLQTVGFLSPDDPRFVATVRAVEEKLREGDVLFRYREDDFGRTETAFVVCTFWYIDALTALGRTDEARTLFEAMLEKRNHVGLLSEDIHGKTRELWGNFPQTYSMVGLINSAMRLSQPWEDAF